MSSNVNRAPRKRHNRFVRILSQIYGVAYNIVNGYYKLFNESLEMTKRKLDQIAAADAELSTIDSVNLLF